VCPILVGARAGGYGRGPVRLRRPTSLRDRGARLLSAAGLASALRRAGAWRGVLVLNHHRVGRPGPDDDPGMFSASTEALDAQLAVVAREADVVGLDELLDGPPAGRGRHVAITFDDGFRDAHDLVLPLLRRHGLRAAFFVASGFVDRPRLPWWEEVAWLARRAAPDAAAAGELRRTVQTRYKRLPPGPADALLDDLAGRAGVARPGPEAAAGMWMTWDMVRALRDAGMVVGGHTADHPVLARLDPEAQRAQVLAGQRRLREELGAAVPTFAYPDGSRHAFDHATRTVLREAGVVLACSFYGGHNLPESWDPLDVRRTALPPGARAERTRAALALPQVFAAYG
jgi:peptidoglycan/xylan/chitin deacetylase (PgdA/CDA1 family)